MYQDKSSSPPKQIQVITKDKSFSPQPWSRHRCPHRQLSSVEKCCRPWRSDCRSVALDYVNIFWSPIIKYWNRTLDEYFIISSPIGKDVLSLIDHLDGLVKGLKWHEHMFLLDVNAFLHCTEHEIFFLKLMIWSHCWWASKIQYLLQIHSLQIHWPTWYLPQMHFKHQIPFKRCLTQFDLIWLGDSKYTKYI